MNQLCVLVVIIVTKFVTTEATSSGWGCVLQRNDDYYDWEPKGNPLLLHANLKVNHMRDIPNSGGSYGMDIT